MSRKIPISFKETTKDIELYIYIEPKEDRSNWIKDVLRKAMKEEIDSKKAYSKKE